MPRILILVTGCSSDVRSLRYDPDEECSEQYQPQMIYLPGLGDVMPSLMMRKTDDVLMCFNERV